MADDIERGWTISCISLMILEWYNTLGPDTILQTFSKTFSWKKRCIEIRVWKMMSENVACLALTHNRDAWRAVVRRPLVLEWDTNIRKYAWYLFWWVHKNSKLVYVMAKRRTSEWWRHQMETLFSIPVLCEGIHQSPDGFPHKGPVTRTFCVSFML